MVTTVSSVWRAEVRSNIQLRLLVYHPQFCVMMLNRQFEAPTFAEINTDLRAYHALLFHTATNFFDTSSKEPYAELNAVDNEIAAVFRLLFNFETELRRRIQFYDAEPEGETVAIRSLSEIMKLPPSCRRLVEGEAKRKSSYAPRQKHRGPYRSYTAQEKNHVVQLNQTGMTFAAISKSLEIPQKNVVRWCREGFNAHDTSRRIADSQMEVELAAWIVWAKRSGLVKQTDIQQKARELSTNPLFKASRGWLKNFMRRFSKEIKQQEEQAERPNSQ